MRRLCWENGTCRGKRETSAASSHWFFRNVPKAGVSFMIQRRRVRPKQNNNLIEDLSHFLADRLFEDVSGNENALKSARQRYWPREVLARSAVALCVGAKRAGGSTGSEKSRMRENFLQRRVIKPLVKLLRQGVTPEKLALSLALSVTLAEIPAFGWSVWLC